MINCWFHVPISENHIHFIIGDALIPNASTKTIARKFQNPGLWFLDFKSAKRPTPMDMFARIPWESDLLTKDQRR